MEVRYSKRNISNNIWQFSVAKVSVLMRRSVMKAQDVRYGGTHWTRSPSSGSLNILIHGTTRLELQTNLCQGDAKLFNHGEGPY